MEFLYTCVNGEHEIITKLILINVNSIALSCLVSSTNWLLIIEQCGTHVVDTVCTCIMLLSELVQDQLWYY